MSAISAADEIISGRGRGMLAGREEGGADVKISRLLRLLRLLRYQDYQNIKMSRCQDVKVQISRKEINQRDGKSLRKKEWHNMLKQVLKGRHQ